MPHGAQDFSTYRRESASYPVKDFAEATSRLGSIVTYDGRGDVFWLDDFEGGLSSWDTLAEGDNNYIGLTTNHPYSKGLCCVMSVSSYDERIASIVRPFSLLVAKRIGLEAAISFGPTCDYFFLGFRFALNATFYEFYVQYDPQTERLRYYTGAGTWSTFATQLGLPFGWHHFKLVIDKDANRYIRLLLDERFFDLSEFEPAKTAATGSSLIHAIIEAHGRYGQKMLFFVDDVIMTHNEP